MKLLILCIALLSIETIYGQTVPATVNESVITAGTSYKRLNDGFVLSYPATGNTVNVGYDFIKTNAAMKINISADASLGSLSNRYTTVKTQTLDLRFSQGFSLLKSRNEKLNSYWGYSIQANPSFIKAAYKDETRDSWSTLNDLSLYQSLVYTSGRNKLIWDIMLPLVGIASRPPVKSSYYNTTNGLLYDSYSNLFFTSWHNHQSVSSSLEVRRALNEQIHIVLGGRFAYNSLQKDYSYKETQAGIYGGVALSIK